MHDGSYNPNHKELCDRAAHWLRQNRGCKVVLIERNSGCGGEEPDAIGWTCHGHSYLVEVKVSRSDFLSDKKKPHRKDQDTGVGLSRYYLCPKGIISPDEVPEGWGLLWATNYQIRVKNNDGDGSIHVFKIDQKKEMQMLIHNYRLARLGVMIVPHDPGEPTKQ